MITSIRLKNFKNFADETLRVGPFTLLVGANASGKSNIRDAFRFLHGIGQGYTLAEIFGGKREAGWKPIRGAMDEITRFGQQAFSIEIELKLSNGNTSYLIEAGADKKRYGEFGVAKEELKLESTPIYTAHSDGINLRVCGAWDQTKKDIPFDLGRPALTQLIKFFRREQAISDRMMEELCSILSDMRFLELSPEQMREPAFPGATLLGDRGENLPVVLREICTDPKRKELLTSWLAELTPMDVKDFEFPTDPSGRVHLTICEKNGRKVSAASASDGTLRFLAMLAVLLDASPNGLYFFEEIDTGIHPARQWLLLELIEKQTAKNNIQIITTTHAPDLLTFVNDSTFENMSVVCRLEDSQDAVIRRVAELPNAKDLRTSKEGLGRLLAEGWMETALAFTEDLDEAEADGE